MTRELPGIAIEGANGTGKTTLCTYLHLMGWNPPTHAQPLEDVTHLPALTDRFCEQIKEELCLLDRTPLSAIAYHTLLLEENPDPELIEFKRMCNAMREANAILVLLHASEETLLSRRTTGHKNKLVSEYGKRIQSILQQYVDLAEQMGITVLRIDTESSSPSSTCWQVVRLAFHKTSEA